MTLVVFTFIGRIRMRIETRRFFPLQVPAAGKLPAIVTEGGTKDL